ncbi:MAG: transporter [Nocardioides sp.]|jgi:branched-chain amino acid transport system ATP-binding protein|nr:transporter [Nocardioides sp.]
MTLLVSDVDVHYGRRLALAGANLRLEAGEVVSVVGPNGAGKSTLLNCISGLIPSSSGSVASGDTVLTKMPAERVVRQGVALVPEGKHVFTSLTVAENLRLAAAAFPGSSGEAIERAIEQFPKLQERRPQRASSLSGGEQQQLMIARALVGSPQFLLLDEPSMGLAPQVVQEVFSILRTLAASGVGVLLVEQFVTQAVAVTDRVHVLARGRVGPSMTQAEAKAAIAAGTFFEAYSGRSMQSADTIQLAEEGA